MTDQDRNARSQLAFARLLPRLREAWLPAGGARPGVSIVHLALLAAAALLAALASCVAREHGVPEGRVFAAGLSAGGAMAAISARTGLPTGSSQVAKLPGKPVSTLRSRRVATRI